MKLTRRTMLALPSALAAQRCLAAPAPPVRPRLPITRDNVAALKSMQQLQRCAWEIVWMPKGRQVAMLAWEQTVEVLDSATFKPVRTIGAGRKLIHFAASPDGRRLALVENNARVQLLDEPTGNSVLLETRGSQPKPAFSPDGKLIATGGYGTVAKLWDAATGKLVRELPAGGEGGLTVVFSPDGKTLAVGNRNDSTRLFEVATGKELHRFAPRSTHELRFSPNGKTLAAAYVEGSVRLWDVATGREVRGYKTKAEEIYTLAWSARGDVLASAGSKGSILLHDGRDLSVLKELPASSWVIKARFSPDGDRLLTCDRTCVTVWGLDRAALSRPASAPRPPAPGASSASSRR